MSEVKDCKGCSASVKVSQEEIESLLGRLSAFELVSEEAYRNRLDRCSECDALSYGTTCRYCGCLVQVKAKLKTAKCPYPYEPRW